MIKRLVWVFAATAVLAGAQAARAEWLVTGDRHLLDAGDTIRGQVLTVAALARAEKVTAED